MAFLEKTFFEDVRPDQTGGPMYRTTVKTTRGGSEKRNALWKHPLRKYMVSLPPQDTNKISELIDFVADTEGAAHSFRLRDWSDYKSCPPLEDITRHDQTIGVGDGETFFFPLTKSYGDGEYRRPIMKPRPETLRIAIDGVLLNETDGYLDTTNGVYIFANAPEVGTKITAGFEFDVPVRFSEDMTDIGMIYYKMGSSSGIGLQEVRLQYNIDVAIYNQIRLIFAGGNGFENAYVVLDRLRKFVDLDWRDSQ